MVGTRRPRYSRGAGRAGSRRIRTVVLRYVEHQKRLFNPALAALGRVVLDCELLPWSAKAMELIRCQYAPVGVRRLRPA